MSAGVSDPSCLSGSVPPSLRPPPVGRLPHSQPLSPPQPPSPAAPSPAPPSTPPRPLWTRVPVCRWSQAGGALASLHQAPHPLPSLCLSPDIVFQCLSAGISDVLGALPQRCPSLSSTFLFSSGPGWGPPLFWGPSICSPPPQVLNLALGGGIEMSPVASPSPCLAGSVGGGTREGKGPPQGHTAPGL